jgi:hypothetical protein
MTAPMSEQAAPGPELVAVLAAAVEASWPRPTALPADESSEQRRAWRFSGRWWARPSLARRDRPEPAR